MGRLLEYLKSAIKQITSNGYRTLMTMLGIIIGIAAVIAVIALGNGMSDYITEQFNSLASASGTVSLDPKKTTEKITVEDMKEIKGAVANLKGITPVFYANGGGKVKTRRGTFLSEVAGMTEGGLYYKGSEMEAGAYFTEQQVENASRVCVMLDTDADQIFGTRKCIGMPVELSMGSKSVEYTVIGLRKNKSALLDLLRGDESDFFATVEIPYTAYGSDFDVDISNITSVEIYSDTEHLKECTDEAREIIAQNHGLRGTDMIKSNVFESLGEMLGSSLEMVRKFLMLVSAISLLVGGIGVMNIMLVSVTERTREIGIRKSIGARTKAIMIQFLAESALLTLIGGIMGIIVGIVIAFFLCRALGFRFIITAGAVVGTALFSVVIGIFFGLYPARRAAKMKPIDALRI